MEKKMVLETMSPSQRRAKLNGNWFTLSPFIQLDSLKFGQEYTVKFELEKQQWYIAEMKDA